MTRPYWILMAVASLTMSFPLSAVADEVATTGWRGDGSGRFPDTQPPTVWSKHSSNIVWKTETGRGYSSPVICKHPAGSRLFVTSEPAEVLCIAATDGAVLWQQTVGYAAALGEAKAKRIEETHAAFDVEKREVNKQYGLLRKENPDSPKLESLKRKRQEVDMRRKEFERQYPPEKRGGAGNAAATVVCDGSRVFVLFGTGVVASLDVDGQLLWARHLEGPTQGFGHSASPVLAGGRLIVHLQNLIGLDVHTGKEIWRHELPAKFGTPAVTRIGDDDVVITPSGALVVAKDGRLLAERQFELSENSPLVHGNIVYAQEVGKVKALRLQNDTRELGELELLWEAAGSREQRMASALYHDGLLYAGGRRGIMEVIDAETGELVYRQRLDVGELFPSPALAGGLVFFGGKDGQTLVLRPGRQYEELANNESDRFSTSPVFENSRMYLRTDKFLYCIGE